jgi:prevent-host-death family protein
VRAISQRDLRNQVGSVLHRAEAGESFVITVHGRPVATLGPYKDRHWVSAATFRQILATPTDPTVLEDLRQFG